MNFVKTVYRLDNVFLQCNMKETTNNPFQSIFESVVEGVILTGEKGEIILANTASEKLFGYDVGELIGVSIENLVPKNIRKVHTNHRASFEKESSSRRMGAGRDLFGLHKDGSLIPVEISLSHTVIDDKRVVIAFVIDITERKRIEQALQKEKEAAKMYLEIAGAFLMVLDHKGDITMINQKGCLILENTEHNILGKNWFDNYIPAERREAKRKIFNRIINKDSTKLYFEDVAISKSGTLKTIEWDFVLIPSSSNLTNSLMCSGVDISSRKKAETALKKSEEKLIVYATELEKRVGKRTKQLADANTSLEKANVELQEEIKVRKEAEEKAQRAFAKEKELNELKSRFVSLASHEFRTPLSTILSSVSLIDRYETAETLDKRKKHIHRIKNNVNNLTSLLNDFLNLEILEEGRFQANCEAFDLPPFMQEMQEEAQSITKSSQTITLYQGEDVSEVYLDKLMLKNICFNLLSNAIKYSDPQQEIEFRYSRKEEKLEIQVRDYGLGIPKSEQAHLFKRFFRAKNVSGIQGTGLGLYIVKKYVEQMSGSITFESEYQKGSTFTIQLPIRHDKNTTD